MSMLDRSGSVHLGDRSVKRLGYGAMQLAGPGVFGPPRDPAAALEVLRAAVAAGVDHIDTSDFYGSHVTNRLIPGTASLAHLQENLAAAALEVPEDALAALDSVGSAPGG